MSRFCTGCGKVIPDNAAFCTECGTPAPADTPQEAQRPQQTAAEQTAQTAEETPGEQAIPKQTAYTPSPQPEPVVQQTYQIPVPPAALGSKVVGTGAFFGLILLFAIPVIGWLACLVMAFAPKNNNIKHYARAMLIWLIIGIVLAVACYFVFRWLGGVLMDYINQVTDGAISEWGDMLEQFRQFQNGGISSLPTI